MALRSRRSIYGGGRSSDDGGGSVPHSHIQSVLFPRASWDIEGAIAWLDREGLESGKVDVTDRFFRFRQQEPDDSKHYATREGERGIHFIITHD